MGDFGNLLEKTMSDKYPLYPELPEAGRQEAQALIDKFKIQMEKVCKDTLGELYVDVACFIESDSWTNFRNRIMDGFKDYNNRELQADYDFKQIRQQIYKDFQHQINRDLNQDNLEKIKQLEERIHQLTQMLSNRY